MIKQRLTDIYKKKILAYIRDNQNIPRSELQKLTGVRMPTVIGIIDVLVKKGLVVERKSAVKQSTKGRPSYCLSLNHAFRLSIGIDIMGDTVHIALVGFDGVICKTLSVQNGPQLGVKLKETVVSLIAESGVSRLEGIVVSFPGFAHSDGSIVFSSVIKDMSSFSSIAEIARKNGIRFQIENPPKAIAVEEARLHPEGAFVLAEIDEGVGCCIINNGRLYTTEGGLEGEIGHIAVPGSTVRCGCGSIGCVEALIRPGAIVAGVKSAVAENNGTLVYYLAKKNIEAIDFDLIARASEEGDEFINTFLRKSYSALSVLLRSVILMCNPERIVLTGRLTMCKSILSEAIDNFKQTSKDCSIRSLTDCRIEVKPYDPIERARLSALSLFNDLFI